MDPFLLFEICSHNSKPSHFTVVSIFRNPHFADSSGFRFTHPYNTIFLGIDTEVNFSELTGLRIYA